jgi:outer membrane protein OmpA-like peptidoglycan-associated protein
MRQRRKWLFLCVALALVVSGCASKKYVSTEVGDVETRITERVDGVESQVEANQTRLDQQEKDIGEVSQTAQEALDRALAAGKLAEGKFLYETLLTDENVRFDFNQADLTEPAMSELDTFAQRLSTDNANVFIEIQGHTDSTGAEDYNIDLGERRAEATRRYLNMSHGVPLHRMSVISYGESAPIADNGTREGRSLNRRIALVVLQ